MIISASRRTDIPAFFSDWFYTRLKEQLVYVRNPFNFNQISKISLAPEAVDAFVFWTKNPAPFLERLHLLKEYHYYFLFTLNPYDQDLEINVPATEKVQEIFKRLADTIGCHRVIWRYDPILFTPKYDYEYHCQAFQLLADSLGQYTDTCIISFVTLYKKCIRNLHEYNLYQLPWNKKKDLLNHFYNLAGENQISLVTCAVDDNFNDLHIPSGKCINGTLINRLRNENINYKKDRNQRHSCGCVKSIDIGTYNTCQHLCAYCYANTNKKIVWKNLDKHCPASLFLGD